MNRPASPPWTCLLLLLAGFLCQCASPPSAPPASRFNPPAPPPPWQRVTARLAAAVPADRGGRPISWKFSIREAPGVNARSWPDGRIEVTSGTGLFVESEPELAAVVAHEMAHVFCRHGWKRALESWAVVLGGAALGAMLADRDGDAGTALGVASGAVLTTSLTVLASRQRQQEFEADRVSLDLLRRAGYPPRAAAVFWHRYAAARAGQGLGGGGWWKAHPPDAERVRRLQEQASSG